MALTHVDGIDATHFTVRNAFGDELPWALCPSQPAVREYAATVVAETVRAAPLAGVVFESVGPLGVDHDGAHSKTAGANWSDIDRALLSICFCGACDRLLSRRRIDTDDLRARVRGRVHGGQDDGEDDIEARLVRALGIGPAAAVIDVRRTGTDELLRGAMHAARDGGVSHVSVHVTTGSWSDGPFAAAMTDGVDVDRWIMSDSAAIASSSSAAVCEADDRLPGSGVWASGMRADAPDDLARAWAGLGARGFDEITLYHWGLLSERRLQGVIRAAEAFRGQGYGHPLPR